MKANHIPVADRLRTRIAKLQARADAAHVPSHSRRQGNPYYMCSECHIHDPELSIRNGKHFGRCSMQGIDKQIAHFQKLLGAVA